MHATLPAGKPEWLKVKSNTGEENAKVVALLRNLNLHTVCEEADCPNLGECFRKQTATFMILGKNCTRGCTFCTVSKALPSTVDPDEPQHIAHAVRDLGLHHVVVTSVTRDDLPDGGAFQFAKVILAIKQEFSEACPVIEVLIPDMQGNAEALFKVVQAQPGIINHNIETVPRLYPEVRPQADYNRSLEVLRFVRKNAPGILTKSGIMLGLGETKEEIILVMSDLLKAGCDILTLGQYLAPSKKHHPVVSFVPPQEFEWYKKEGEKMGFQYVASGPLVRSSYMAEHAYTQIHNQEKKVL